MKKDVLVNSQNDLEWFSGDFWVSHSDEQNVQMLLKSEQGQWKQHPEAGCFLQKNKNGNINRFFERNLRVQLQADGFSVKKLSITPMGIHLEGSYE